MGGCGMPAGQTDRQRRPKQTALAKVSGIGWSEGVAGWWWWPTWTSSGWTDAMIRTAMSSEHSGSTQYQRSGGWTSSAEISTPIDPRVSASICRKIPRMFWFPWSWLLSPHWWPCAAACCSWKHASPIRLTTSPPAETTSKLIASTIAGGASSRSALSANTCAARWRPRRGDDST